MRTLARDGHRVGRRLLGSRPRGAARAPRRRGVPARPRAGRRVVPEDRQADRGRQGGGRRGDPPGLRLPGREPRPGARLRGERHRLDRSAREGDRRDGLEDRRARDHEGGRDPDHPRHHRAGRRRRRRAKKIIDDSVGYPVAIKAVGGGGGKGFRVALERGRARGRVRGRLARGREVLRRPDGLHRALPAGPAPRRAAGAGRLARQRHPPRRARLLAAAPPPEADRGVARRRPSRTSCARRSARSPSRRRRRSTTARPARSRACSRTTSGSSWR